MNDELKTSPSSEALAYIAGLFDGEGSVSARRLTRLGKYVWK
jgi:intein/homing endonuclease